MRAATILLAVGGLGLLGVGVWLGRTSSATPEPAAQVAAAPRSAALPPPSPASPGTTAPAPALQRPAPSRALLADLGDRDVKVRRAAIKELGRDRDADPALLLAASRDADPEVGVLATEALGRLHATGALPASELIARASDRGSSKRVRTAALNALGTTASPESAAYLAGLLDHGDSFERLNAAILIGHQDLDVAVPALIRALGDGEERVRANALETLRTHARGRDFGSDAAAWQAWWQSRPR